MPIRQDGTDAAVPVQGQQNSQSDDGNGHGCTPTSFGKDLARVAQWRLMREWAWGSMAAVMIPWDGAVKFPAVFRPPRDQRPAVPVTRGLTANQLVCGLARRHPMRNAISM